MASSGEQQLQAMKEQRQIERIHAVYNKFIAELNSLDAEQNVVIQQILQHIDHEKIKNILTTINSK